MIRLLSVNISLSFLLAGVPCLLFARGYNNTDSLIPIIVVTKPNTIFLAKDSLLPKAELIVAEEGFTTELNAIEETYTGKEKNRNTLLKLLKAARVKRILHYTKSRQRLLADIAGVSAKLRLYPFAMQCYFLSTIDDDNILNTSSFTDEMVQEPINLVDTNTLTITDEWQKESIPVSTASIEQPFDDGKESIACALVLHVKQPSPGKRKAFTGVNNVGHMFITLIKYNTDKSIVSRTFGFYPEKSDVFDGTPLHPSAASVIKDDSFHGWDEVAGKFISYRRLQRILRLLNKYQNKKYHLNKNNCTDFGLNIATIGGIDIENTKGKWPFGKGNNPGAAGQSLLEGKLKNSDTGTKAGLFLCNTNDSLTPALLK